MTERDLIYIRSRRKEIDGILARIETLRSLAEKMTATPPDGLPRSKGAAEDKTASVVAKLIELEDRLVYRVIEYEEGMIDIESTLEQLPPEQGMILRLRYIDGKRWDEIADEMNYSKRRCYGIKREAMQSVHSFSPFSVVQ